MVNKIKRSNIKRQTEIYLSKLYYIETLNLDRNDLSIVHETILILTILLRKGLGLMKLLSAGGIYPDKCHSQCW